MASEPQKQQDARRAEKKTMSVKFDDRDELGCFCRIFLRNSLKESEWQTRSCLSAVFRARANESKPLSPPRESADAVIRYEGMGFCLTYLQGDPLIGGLQTSKILASRGRSIPGRFR
jgi:hypothetical protein